MKRKLISVVVVILILVGLFTKREELLYFYYVSDFQKIEAEEFDGLDFDEEIYLYFGRSTCPYCREFVTPFSKAAEIAGVNIFYVDTEKTAEDLQLKDLRAKLAVELVPAVVKYNPQANEFRHIVFPEWSVSNMVEQLKE